MYYNLVIENKWLSYNFLVFILKSVAVAVWVVIKLSLDMNKLHTLYLLSIFRPKWIWRQNTHHSDLNLTVTKKITRTAKCIFLPYHWALSHCSSWRHSSFSRNSRAHGSESFLNLGKEFYGCLWWLQVMMTHDTNWLWTLDSMYWTKTF